MSEAPVKVFVYGSLRHGFFNYEKVLVDKAASHKPARTKGRLYHMPAKGYPAILPGEGWVEGELLELDAAVLPLLDEIENYQPDRAENEYNRRLAPVEVLETGQPEQAFVYWYGRPLDTNNPAQAVAIPHGDWKAFMLGES